jgi:hypothetical protein
MKNGLVWLLSALILAVGVALGGWFIGDGFLEGRAGDRYVTVKGVAERTVKADLALWPIRFVATGNDLSQVQTEIEHDAQSVTAFLLAQGIPAPAIELQSLNVTDLHAETYRSGPVESRFIVSQTLMVRSSDVDRIAAARERQTELVDKGVVVSGEAGPGGGGPYYLFTRLTEFKPEMIVEATQNARAAATQFAADSESALGGIRRANQGIFEILPRDNTPGMMQQQQIHKTLRVVSTIEYLLLD